MSRFIPSAAKSSRWYPRRYFQVLGLLLAAITLVPGVLKSQQLTGSLTGTSYDQAGLMVPNANIELRNDDSGDVRKTVSNSSGSFTVSALPAGSYTITVSAAGFNSWQQKGIALGQGDNRTIPNINLKIGGTTQQVDVVATGEAAVPVDSGEVSVTLNNHMVTELALVGRDAGELLKIMPGMALNNGLTQGSGFTDQVVGSNSGPVGAFSANGTQPNGALAYMLDGANLVDPGNQGTQIANINQDMTQEVKVLMSSYGAEFAKGPVVFQAISKSGGKDFHGEGYLYARNSIFNSVDAFSKSLGGNNADQKYYYPGGNIGGPVLIPHTNFNKNRDKLFFWFGYEYMNQHPAAVPQGYFVPTPEMLGGNFSPAYLATLPSNVAGRYGSAVSVPKAAGITNGIIPSSLFDPNAQALLKLYPKPNADPATHGGNNYEYVNASPQNRWEQTEKIDYAVSDNTKLTVSYSRQVENDLHPIATWWAPPTSLPYPSNMIAKTTANVVMANATHVFSPTLTNETVFTWARYINPLSLANPAAVDPAKIGFNVAGLFGVKEKQIPNILSWSGALAEFMPQAVYGGQFQGGQFGGLKSDPAFYDNISKVAGTHTMKFGFYWDQNGNQQSSSSPFNGQYEFETWGSTSTGNVIADLLTGHAQSYTQANTSPVQDVKYHQYSAYAQDSWKATRRLTLNYGIRFDHEGQWYTKNGLIVFNAAKYDNSSTAGANTGLSYHAIDKSIPLSGWKSPLAYPDPRFGVAYDLFGNGRTVLRGGIAVFRYQVGVGTVGGAADAANGSFSYTINNLTSLASIAQATVPSTSSLNGTTIYTMKAGDNKVPGTTDYNFTISQASPWRSVMEVSYVGNRSFDLLTKGSNSKVNDPNAIPAGSFFKPDPITGKTPCVVGTCTGLNTNDYYPLRNYQDIYEAAHTSYSNYNSLQVAWQKQTGHASFLLNYTFSKVLGIRDGVSDNGAGAGAMVDPFVIRNNYGILAYDHTHVFNASYVINLPSPIHNNALLGGVVNGWEVSGYTALQSGAPIQPNGGLNIQWPNAVSNQSYLGTNAITLVPALTCDPRSGLKSGQYFNPSCFTVPAPGTNGALIWPYIRGPKYFNSDLAAYKNFKMGERRSVQFRASASNFLNHPQPQFGRNGNGDISLNFQGPSASISPTNTNVNTTGTPAYTVGSRLITLAVKFYF